MRARQNAKNMGTERDGQMTDGRMERDGQRDGRTEMLPNRDGWTSLAPEHSLKF